MQQKRKLSIPAVLLKELEAQGPAHHGARVSRSQPSRKEQRKAQRVTKRQARANHTSRPVPKPPPKPTPASQRARVIDEDDSEKGDDDNDLNLDEGPDGSLDSDDDFDLGEGDSEADEKDYDSDPDKDAHTKSQNITTSKSDLKKMAQDDAEIADLERKLGLKGGKSMPNDFDEDGLGELLEGLGSGEEDSAESSEKFKRKAEADEWLAQKRRKAQATAAKSKGSTKSGRKLSQRVESFGNSDDYEESDNDGFSGFSDEEANDKEGQRPRQRENPYIAPTSNVAKYVPPSLRRNMSDAQDRDAQLRKRIQGLVNRLTNDSMIGIAKDISNLYTTNPRQAVTTNLTDIVLTLVCSPEKRPDAFFTMIAGFIAALHKTMGMAFTAQFVQHLVEMLDKFHAHAAGDHSDTGSKHAAILLSELYNMQVISGNLVFDYVRLFLEKLNELNTELLLRIIQLCGPALRREDPQSLQQIVKRAGHAKGMSVRTSFMIEEMEKLQSNKTKANARNKDLADQRTQIRKKIGTLRSVQDSQPLRIGLQDIHNADKAGKWWLVGASWAGNSHDPSKADGDDYDEDEDVANDNMDFGGADDDFDIPDLWQLAREQGFNTEVRQRIFVALHAATDYENAELLLKKLKLNKHQRKQIPEVIVRSGERQMEYNQYYALVASRFCVDRQVRFQFRRCLMTRYGKMGEDIDMDDEDEVGFDDEAEYSIRWLYNTAKLYGSLVVNGCLGLVDVVKRRNLMALQEKPQMFVELVFITLLQELSQSRLKEVLGGLDEDLVRGVQYFIKKHVRGTDLVRDKKEAKKLKKACDNALEILDGMQTIDAV